MITTSQCTFLIRPITLWCHCIDSMRTCILAGNRQVLADDTLAKNLLHRLLVLLIILDERHEWPGILRIWELGHFRLQPIERHEGDSSSTFLVQNLHDSCSGIVIVDNIVKKRIASCNLHCSLVCWNLYQFCKRTVTTIEIVLFSNSPHRLDAAKSVAVHHVRKVPFSTIQVCS